MSTLQKIQWLLVITCGLCSKFPEGFQKCNPREADFSECLTKAVENALRQLNKPIEEYGLYLDPLEIPPFSVAAKNKTAAFIQDYKNYKMYGFSDVNYCSKVGMDFETNNLIIHCTFPKITTVAEYHFDGKLHDLKFNASGAASDVMKNLKIHLSFILDEYEKDGQMYYRVIKHKFEMDPESIENIDLGNIVDGDSLQSNKVNEAFNENSDLIFDDIKADYEEPFGNQIATIFNNFLNKVSISEIFDNY